MSRLSAIGSCFFYNPIPDFPLAPKGVPVCTRPFSCKSSYQHTLQRPVPHHRCASQYACGHRHHQGSVRRARQSLYNRQENVVSKRCMRDDTLHLAICHFVVFCWQLTRSACDLVIVRRRWHWPDWMACLLGHLLLHGVWLVAYPH